MAHIIWTEKALDDFETLLVFIAKDAPMAASRFAQQMIFRVELLQDHPLLGSEVPEDDTHTYRKILQSSFRIIYRFAEDAIYLVTIHHAARLLDFDDVC